MEDRSDTPAWTGLRALIPSAIVAMLSIGVTAAVAFAPAERGEVAVMFPFGTSEVDAFIIVVAAGGSIVSSTRLSNVVVAFSPDAMFHQRVRDGGALLTFAAASGLCRLPPETTSTPGLTS